MSNPFGADTVDDYGTVSGHSRGFRTRGSGARAGGIRSLSMLVLVDLTFVLLIVTHRIDKVSCFMLACVKS